MKQKKDEKLWEEKSFISCYLQILYHQMSIQKFLLHINQHSKTNALPIKSTHF